MLSVLIPNAGEPHLQQVITAIETTIPATEVIIAHDRDRKGKGWAMREAFSSAKGDYIAFIDGDLDIQPRMLKRLIPFLEDFDMILGSKRVDTAPLHRKILTHLSRLYIRVLFGIPFDTQTGVKLFKREALDIWETDDFAFTLEIICSGMRRGMKIVEVPVEATITAPVSWKIVLKSFLSSLKIWFFCKY